VKFSLLGVHSYHLLSPASSIATACYVTVGFAIALVAAAQRNGRREREVLAASVAAGVCGFALYYICPVVGPLQAFGPAYPNVLPPPPVGAPLINAVVGVPRNGMPSLHAVWALLIWFNAEPLPSDWRRILRLCALMILWAAMGLDDTHWLTDIVVAVPLAVAIQLTFVTETANRSCRWRDASCCAALCGLWLLAFRAAEPLLSLPKPLAWLAVVITVSWPLTCRGASLGKSYPPLSGWDVLSGALVKFGSRSRATSD
jgi:PAP2 superfamily